MENINNLKSSLLTDNDGNIIIPKTLAEAVFASFENLDGNIINASLDKILTILINNNTEITNTIEEINTTVEKITETVVSGIKTTLLQSYEINTIAASLELPPLNLNAIGYICEIEEFTFTNNTGSSHFSVFGVMLDFGSPTTYGLHISGGVPAGEKESIFIPKTYTFGSGGFNVLAPNLLTQSYSVVSLKHMHFSESNPVFSIAGLPGYSRAITNVVMKINWYEVSYG